MEGTAFSHRSPGRGGRRRRTPRWPGWTRCCGRRGPPRRSWRRSPSARRCAPTSPRSRPPRWPRSRPARSPRQQLAWGSTAEWFTHLAGTHRGTGTRAVRHAKLLVRERSPTRDALRDGRVSPGAGGGHLRRDRGAPHQPGDPGAGREDPARRGRPAARHRPGQGRPAPGPRRRPRGRRAQGREGPRPRQDRAAHLGRFLAIVEDGAGGVRLRGRGTVEDAATIKAALLPLTKPTPADQAAGRSAGRSRRSATTAPGCGTPWSRPPSTPWPPTCRPTPTAPGPGSRSPPASTRCRGRIDWTTDRRRRQRAAHPPRSGAWPATPTSSPSPSAPAARSSTSAAPTAWSPRALWRALVCRDRHCAFPGCTKPPVMGHAHHIVHWADGGPTCLDNLVLLCGHHHRVIHHTPWQVRINPDDGRPEFLPPPKPGRPPPTPGVDPATTPTRVARARRRARRPSRGVGHSEARRCYARNASDVAVPGLPDPGTEAHSVSR